MTPVLIHPSRLTTYLDEISDDPIQAIRLAQATYGLNMVCLRRAWTGSIVGLNDVALAHLKAALGPLKILLLNSELGLQTINVPDKEFEQPFLIANYFGARFLRVHIGNQRERGVLSAWIKKVGDRAIRASITPVFEFNPDYGNMAVGEILSIVSEHPRWRVLYDPAQYIIRRNLNPFVNYWQVLRHKIVMVDLRDYKIGTGFKLAGMGDCQLKATINDANASGLPIYFALEPGLGRRFANATDRETVFKMAWEQLVNL